MEIKGVFTTLIAALAFQATEAQPPSGVPKLVVGITIDQFRQDYLELFSPLYGEKGFRRIMKEGRYYTRAEYDYAHPDRASSIASLFSGTVPTIHGIVAEKWLDPSTLLMKNCVDDPHFMGNYTTDNSSAELLQTSTLGDELKIATDGKALVYAVSAYREGAILSAGHAADGAFWLDDANGMWCGTTYYPAFPVFVSTFNMQEGTDVQKNSLVWSPLHPSSEYTYLPFAYPQDGFTYKFTDYQSLKYKKLKTSPLINNEINRLLQKTLVTSGVGTDQIPDLLSVTYYAGTYDHDPVRESGMELQDTYARLDRTLAELLEMVDKQVGLHNTLFFITSTGYSDPEPQDLKKFRVPTGEFHPERCKALLNMYLMALYGQGQWVEAYEGLQLYLNHKLIEEKQLTLQEVLQKSCEFLIQISGVKEVYSSVSLLQAAWVPEVRKIRNAYHRTRSGDLLIEVMPGWTVVNTNNPGNDYIVRKAYLPQPLIFLGAGVKPEKIEIPVTIDRVAPTVSKAIRIRAPNGCTSQPLF